MNFAALRLNFEASTKEVVTLAGMLLVHCEARGGVPDALLDSIRQSNEEAERLSDIIMQSDDMKEVHEASLRGIGVSARLVADLARVREHIIRSAKN